MESNRDKRPMSAVHGEQIFDYSMQIFMKLVQPWQEAQADYNRLSRANRSMSWSVNGQN